MADLIVDAATKVQFVPTIASAAFAPTMAEIAAGTSLELVLTKSGLKGFDPSTAEIDNTSLGSTDDTKVPGRVSYSGTALEVKKQTIGTDPAYAVLSVMNTTGFIVIRDGMPAATAFAAAQKVDVYPVQLGRTGKVGRGEENSLLRFLTPCSIRAAVVFDVAVLA